MIHSPESKRVLTTSIASLDGFILSQGIVSMNSDDPCRLEAKVNTWWIGMNLYPEYAARMYRATLGRCAYFVELLDNVIGLHLASSISICRVKRPSTWPA